MKTARNLLHFLLVAAIGTVACVVLLLQRSPWPCDRVVPAPHVEVATLGNATQEVDPSMKNHGKQKAGSSAAEDKDDKLPELLRTAAMEDRTIIMTFTNEAWTAPGSLLDLFLESFRIGVRTEPLLKHLIIVAIDQKAFERCQELHPLCYALPVGGGVNFESEQSYMARDYVDMLWRRNRFQARVLGLGYGFVFTDVDIVWFRNPLLRVPVGVDFAMSCDSFYGDNPYDLNKRANGGFVYARPSARTLAFYGDWYESRNRYRGQHEQFVFDRVKHELVARSGVAAQFVDTDYLGGFCERGKRRDFNKLCTYHANCLVGLKTKLQKLRGVLDEWKRFKDKAGKPGSNITALTD
ncbi:hypothetical protein SEVIR_2G275700v4 [Setaria viridis]|uniref:Nucleotide-diphospho-sugar transferase domain-containing protein n=1 Tax=Setaria viridis TaxID=4556 RepID=A0A4U6VYK3_SETVI|nr:uncharacterized protein At4g15970-like [Setaria viridis]TKW33993.1 hypothetical protein SEVIR_2G275700v2 [Setaria viridis]